MIFLFFCLLIPSLYYFGFFIFPPFSSYDFERDIARILQEQEFVTKRMKEFEEGFASSQSPTKPEAKVGFAAIQEMARLQEAEEDDETLMDSNPRPQQKQGGCDLSFLRFDPQSNRMTLESSATSSEKPAKFPLEIPTPSQSPNIGHRLRRMGSSPGSWRFDFIWFPLISTYILLYIFSYLRLRFYKIPKEF